MQDLKIYQTTRSQHTSGAVSSCTTKLPGKVPVIPVVMLVPMYQPSGPFSVTHTRSPEDAN